MKIILLKEWQHEGGRVYPEKTILTVHPTDGEKLIADKVAKKYKPGIIKQIKNKIDGNDRKD